MSLRFSIICEDGARKRKWMKSLQAILEGITEFQIFENPEDAHQGQMILVDAELVHLNEVLKSLNRRGNAIFLVTDDQSTQIPSSLIDGSVDDVLLSPFRVLDLVSKIRYYEQILLWKEVLEANTSFSNLLQQVKDDFSLAERLQKARLPKRFPRIKGYSIASRYLAGMRSGGDYFDLAESQDGSHYAIVLSSSSSYGLSSALLAVVMKVTLKVAQNHLTKPGTLSSVIEMICEELTMTLGTKENFSLFYGVISRKDNSLRYINYGNTRILFSEQSEPFRVLPNQGLAISEKHTKLSGKEELIQLLPESRVALVSDGFLQSLEGEQSLCQILNTHRSREAVDSLNEMTFRVKSKLNDEQPMPNRDCTALVIDAGSRVLKLTKQERDVN